ncbi:DUF1828 domain-containing protein [Rubrobacter marinus]|uniref:DUF1828 domain-containing protein n=1 Tax=Rubrobacter marinus TaxID=2653852 RepID=A0A6G8PSS4_9ACTN|nr:DUF1828 domain-containing protein [Rubrobacter marinus]QIN77539.1 DUF1828 domain-containing protein [Rubrobacter marinus]
MTLTPCEQIGKGMGELFECSPMEGYTRIRTPYLYPDGDVIDLYLTDHSDPPALTDLGETLTWLQAQTVATRKTARQQRLIEDICLTHGVEFFRGMLVVRVRKPEGFADAATRLSQAILSVADLWFTFRGRTAASINDDVEEFLTGRQIGFERNEKVVGRSGRVWTVDFHTRTPQRSALIYVLSTGSRATSRRLVEHTLATWYDLNNLQVGPEALRFVSLFDDELDVWTPEDFGLLEDLSEVAYWSRKDEFVELLTG